MRPLIGITPTSSDDSMPHGTFSRYALSRTYTDALRQAGGLPMIVPTSERASDVIDRVDGVLLSGGGDIEPARYGDPSSHPRTYGVSGERDAFEIALLMAAIERNLPVLCICRGIQVMNVALGGTLLQHIPDDVPGDIGHRQQERGLQRDDVGHRVRLAVGPHLLRSVVVRDEIDVNSFHHQAVATVGTPLEIVASSLDGVIEALWHPGVRFGLGVQWHPEMLAAGHADHAALFTAFVAAAGES